jgi:HPt (histidine-containing phosphotransfer) domain-containing protein
MSGQNTDKNFEKEVLDSLVETLGNSVSRIVSIYVDDFPISVSTMRQALAKKDYETIGRTAHSLKSSSGNLGASHLVEFAKALEQKINNKVGATEIEAGINSLEAAFQEVLPKLRAYIH